MSDRILVATRKGLFLFARGAAGAWAQAETHFLGEPVSMALADPRDGTLYAALNLGHFGVKLHRQPAGGAWEECAVPVYPPQPDPAPGEPADVPWTLTQIWALEPGGPAEPGVLWAGTLPGGLFRSGDGGRSWSLNRALWDRPERREWFGGGAEQPSIHSICVDPGTPERLTLAVSCGGIWQTEDGGETWQSRASGMQAEYMPPQRREDPNIQDVHRLALCEAQPEVFWAQHHSGIYRSTDGGANWREITQARPSRFGYAVAVHPDDPDTAWFVPAAKDACRVPVDGRLVVSRSRDGGRSFEVLDEGLPPPPAYDLVYRHGLAVDESGERLAMGSTTGGLWVSENGGERWRCLSERLPPIYCVRFA